MASFCYAHDRIAAAVVPLGNRSFWHPVFKPVNELTAALPADYGNYRTVHALPFAADSRVLEDQRCDASH
jgi:hypothetical protein